MLVKGIMELLKMFVLFLIGLVPELPDLSGLKPSVDALFSCYSNLDSFIDVRTCFVCVLALLLAANAELIWAVIMWVVRKIPGVS